MPEQFCDGTQIDSGHNQSTCGSMAVAMPRVSLEKTLFHKVWFMKQSRMGQASELWPAGSNKHPGSRLREPGLRVT